MEGCSNIAGVAKRLDIKNDFFFSKREDEYIYRDIAILDTHIVYKSF